MNDLDNLIDRALNGLRSGQKQDIKDRMIALVIDIVAEAEWRKLTKTDESKEAEELISKMKVSPAYSKTKNVDIMLWEMIGVRR